jgi:hypothetical protein
MHVALPKLPLPWQAESKSTLGEEKFRRGELPEKRQALMGVVPVAVAEGRQRIIGSWVKATRPAAPERRARDLTQRTE